MDGMAGGVDDYDRCCDIRSCGEDRTREIDPDNWQVTVAHRGTLSSRLDGKL